MFFTHGDSMNFRILVLTISLFGARAVGMDRSDVHQIGAADYHSFDSAMLLTADRSEQPNACSNMCTCFRKILTAVRQALSSRAARAKLRRASSNAHAYFMLDSIKNPGSARIVEPAMSGVTRADEQDRAGTYASSDLAKTLAGIRILFPRGVERAGELQVDTRTASFDLTKILSQARGVEPRRVRSEEAEEGPHLRTYTLPANFVTDRPGPLPRAERYKEFYPGMEKVLCAPKLWMGPAIDIDRILTQIGKRPAHIPAMPSQAHADGSSDIESDQPSLGRSAGEPKTLASAVERAPGFAIRPAPLTVEHLRRIDVALVEEGRDAALAIIMSTGVDIDEADRVLTQIGKEPAHAPLTPPQAHAGGSSDIERFNQLYLGGSAGEPETRVSSAGRAPLTAEQLAKIEAALAEGDEDTALAGIMNATGIEFEEADRMLTQIGKQPIQPR